MSEDVERIAKNLTKAQREAIFPGPGNPDYAKGVASTMRSLEAKLVVCQVAHYSSGDGKRGGLLTPLGRRVRAFLASKEQNDAT